MSINNISDFASWPTAPQEQERLAGEVFGRYLVYAFDSWMQTSSKILFDNHQSKNPDDALQKLFKWIENASVEDRQCVFTLVRMAASGTIFSILNKIDGTSGSIINNDYNDRIHVFLDIYRETYESEEEERITSIPINAHESANLHDHWYRWLADYSRYNPYDDKTTNK